MYVEAKMGEDGRRLADGMDGWIDEEDEEEEEE